MNSTTLYGPIGRRAYWTNYLIPTHVAGTLAVIAAFQISGAFALLLPLVLIWLCVGVGQEVARRWHERQVAAHLTHPVHRSVHICDVVRDFGVGRAKGGRVGQIGRETGQRKET